MDIIDSVLMPYEPKQRQDASVIVTDITSSCMERIPQIVDDRGEVNSEFLDFYQYICEAITKSQDIEHLIIRLHRAFLENPSFDHSIIESWLQSSKYFTKKYSEDSSEFSKQSGVDVQIDVHSFSNQHRTMILNLDICTWLLDVEPSDFNSKGVLRLVEEKSTLRFTYKNGKFKLIPYLEPFIQSDIE